MTWTWQMTYAVAGPAFVLVAAGCVWLSDLLFDHLERRKDLRNQLHQSPRPRPAADPELQALLKKLADDCDRAIEYVQRHG